MSFCPTCGRQRNADNRFCAGCGHDFREPAPDGGAAPAAEFPRDDTRLDRPLDATRWEAPLDATRLEPAEPRTPGGSAGPAEPDPFAAWFAPGVPAPPADQPVPPRSWPGDNWQTADTVYATPAQTPPDWPSRQPGPPGPGFPPRPGPPQGPVYGEPPRRPSRGARAALIIVVILVMLGAGGAAYAFISRSNRPSAGPPSGATGSATPSAPASASPSSSSASASPSASATVSASPSPSPSLVSVASSVGSNPATPQVETVLSHFFQGINTHSYTEYTSALDSRERASQTESSFSKGYSTTTDSGMTLTSLTSTGSTVSGGLAATVTFTSHQAASSSVDNSACNTWTLTFYLVPDGSGYLDGSAPSGYQPKYADC